MVGKKLARKKQRRTSTDLSAKFANAENETTSHGDNVADQIVGSDAYGEKGTLTATDVHTILDNMHSNVLKPRQPAKMKLNKLLSKWMQELWKEFPDMEIR